MSAEVVNEILATFHASGAAAYLGEPVTLRQHMLQSALAAEADDAGAELVVAALLHDYGHLIHTGPEDAAAHGLDSAHEQVGHRFLAAHFPPSVVEPVGLHVAAKRYLCAVDPGYIDVLSPASLRSLELQGGPMSATELAEFEALAYFEAACRLRRYDDLAKDRDAPEPPLERYRPLLEAVVFPGS